MLSLLRGYLTNITNITETVKIYIDLTEEDSEIHKKRSCDEIYKGDDVIKKTKTTNNKEETMPIVECPVCFKLAPTSKRDLVVLECKHTVCVKCLESWLPCNNTCPLCRAAVEKYTKYFSFVLKQNAKVGNLVSVISFEKKNFVVPKSSSNQTWEDILEDERLAREIQYAVTTDMANE